MDISALAEQLSNRQQNVSHVLNQLNTITEAQINDQLHTRRSVLSNFVTFCEHQLEKEAYHHIVVLFKVVHKLNSSDHWLLTASNILLPHLQHFYNTIVVDSDVRTLESPIHATQNLSRVLKRNKHALRTLSAIFELCVDFCDVVCAQAHVAEFLKPCIALLSVSDFHIPSITLTETDYALNELLRCASYALSNILLSFESVAESARKMPTRHIQDAFKVLSCAPELSIQRSLIMSLRCLCDVSYGHPSLHNAQPSLSSIEDLIEQKLSSTEFGSSRAIPFFRELDVNADDAVEKSELVVTKMFSRKRKIHKSFKSKPCDVQILTMNDASLEDGSSRAVVLRSVSVEWNTNAICVRDEDGNPFRQWPLFTVSHPEWEDVGRELRLNFDPFYIYPATEVHVSFLAKSLTKYDRKAIDERIDEIMSMATDTLTPGISKGNLQKELGSATPMSASLFQKKQSGQSQADDEHEVIERKQGVETIFSKLNKDGVFLAKERSTSSFVASNEDSSVKTNGTEAPVGVMEQTGPDDKGSGDSTADQDMHSELQRQDYERFESDEDVANKECSDTEALPKARPPELQELGNSRKQKNKVRLRRNSKRFASIQRSRVQSLSRQVGLTTPEDKLVGNSAFLKDNVVADVGCDEMEENGKAEQPSDGKDYAVRDEDTVKAASKRLRRKRAPSPICISSDHAENYPASVEQSLRPKKRRRNMISLSSESAPAIRLNRSHSLEHSPVDQYLSGTEHQSVPDIESEGGGPRNNFEELLGFPETLACANSPPSIEAKLRENLAGLSGASNKKNVKPENKTVRNILLAAIRQVAKWQDANSKRMLLSTKREVETLRDKKKLADEEKLRALETRIKKRGKEQKTKIREYGLRKRKMLMEAKNSLNVLKVKALAIQKHIKRSRSRTKKSIEKTNRRLNELKEKTECVLGELIAKIQKRERKTERGSLLRNLMKILDEN